MRKGLVLVFHQEENGQLFESIIVALQKRYRLVSIGELEQLLVQKQDTRNICHLSFDDGDISFYNAIFPVLKRYKVPASLFLSPDVISTNTNYWFQEVERFDEKIVKEILAEELNIEPGRLAGIPFKYIFKGLPMQVIEKVIAEYRQRTNCGKQEFQNIGLHQLKEIIASGLVEIGAHTLKHPILKNETDSDCIHEISASIKGLQEITGKPVRYFAFPNGLHGLDFGEREMKCLRLNNISMAFSTEIDTLSPENDMLNIPRISFDRMRLHPSNPLIFLRLNMGKKWAQIKSLMTMPEKKMRERVNRLLRK